MELEKATRQTRIDPRLEAAGWTVTPFRPAMSEAIPSESAVEEWPTIAGPADYALCDEHSVRAVVEAKKQSTGAQGILPQAERYSRAIRIDVAWQGEYGVPFLYATNGDETWFHDVRLPQNRSRKVATFHTPNALRELLERDGESEFAKLRAIPLNSGLRPYQVEANTAIEQTVADGKRKMLVTMATGTGKTLMTVNEIYRLMKSGVARRVLFLVDRRALAAQTVRAFARGVGNRMGGLDHLDAPRGPGVAVAGDHQPLDRFAARAPDRLDRLGHPRGGLARADDDHPSVRAWRQMRGHDTHRIGPFDRRPEQRPQQLFRVPPRGRGGRAHPVHDGPFCATRWRLIFPMPAYKSRRCFFEGAESPPPVTRRP